MLEHEVIINADRTTPRNNVAIPTGELALIENGGVFDFRGGRSIGSIQTGPFVDPHTGGGFDHNFALNSPASAAVSPSLTSLESVAAVLPPLDTDRLAFAARVSDPVSHRYMEVYF